MEFDRADLNYRDLVAGKGTWLLIWGHGLFVAGGGSGCYRQAPSQAGRTEKSSRVDFVQANLRQRLRQEERHSRPQSG
jgi:hypothetical protein